ncbi:hypothetical protein HanIR_Chr16g0826021 [Helianthus annuus]|nr:hypothetical protein HanIR_Chr16g0826021 [Helianthus annuus]
MYVVELANGRNIEASHVINNCKLVLSIWSNFSRQSLFHCSWKLQRRYWYGLLSTH